MLRMKVCLALFAVLSLCACATPKPDSVSSQAVGGVAVTVKKAGLALPKGTTFSWAEASSRFYEDARLDDASLQVLLRESIEQALTSRGYKVVAEEGEYEIAYVVALAQSLSDIEINQLFGVNPGLLGDSKDVTSYEKGTLVVDAIDPETDESLWRSALQAYVIFDQKEEVRRERINSAVARLFGSFPSAQ